LVVACGNSTALQITELQLEGSRRMAARDFINGFHPQTGGTLGLTHK
jgi:methionyl-tRNA formyltransferase